MKRYLLLLLLALINASLHAQNVEVLTTHKWKARDTVYSDKNSSGRLIIEQYIDSVVVNASANTYRARGKTMVFSPQKDYTSNYRISGKILTRSNKKLTITYQEISYEKIVAGEKLCPTKGKLRLYASDTPGKYLLKGDLTEMCSRSLQHYVFYSEDRK